jgi:glycine reductase
MLDALVLGKPLISEVPIIQYDTIQPAPPVKRLDEALIGLVTSGGIVPKGNPNHLGSARAEQAFRYNLEGLKELKVDEWESVHGGFNTRWLNTKNPSWALPLPVVRELEEKGVIKKLYPIYFATVGNQTAVTSAKGMGKEIAQEFKRAGVSGVLLVAT